MTKGLTVLILAAPTLVCGQPSQSVTTLRERAKPFIESALDAGQPFAVVSAASGMPNLAADSLASIMGQNLASQTATATAPYPENLAGIGVQVTDSAGAVRMAQLLFVSPGQINLLIPSGTAAGSATVSVLNGGGNAMTGTIQIQTVAPALFTANENGLGVVSATAYRTVIPTTIASPVAVYQCLDAPGSCVSVPIALGIDTPVYVTANATGLRARSSDASVQLTVGAQRFAPISITPQDDNGTAAGVDQLLFGIPLSLRGSGEVDLVITVDGTTSNTARINVM